MKELIDALLNPQVLTAVISFASGMGIIALALMRKYGVISKDDIEFAQNTIQNAKAGAIDLKETMSAITDSSHLTLLEVRVIAEELEARLPGDTNRKKAQRVFRRIRKGFLGF